MGSVLRAGIGLAVVNARLTAPRLGEDNGTDVQSTAH